MNVLIGVDDSVESRHAVDTAFEYFGTDAEYLVVSVGERSPFFNASFGKGDVVSSAQIIEQFDAAESSDRPTGGDPELRVVLGTGFGVGHAGSDLCKIAADHDVDVIVIGSRDTSVWQRLLHPSVGRYLIDHAPCPVVVVR